MGTRIGTACAAVAVVVLGSCDATAPFAESEGMEPAALMAVAVPLKGACTITLGPRVHDDGSDEGSCGGDEHEGSDGGPPISRHYDIAGSCQLTHLGLTRVAGRMNLTGPFGTESHDDGHATLGARGRLVLIAANGDQLVGRYVPLTAAFTPAGGDGGAVTFSSTFTIGESCSGEAGGHTEAVEPAADAHEEPVSTGRFADAFGDAAWSGTIDVLRSTGGGDGTIVLNGTLTY